MIKEYWPYALAGLIIVLTLALLFFEVRYTLTQ